MTTEAEKNRVDAKDELYVSEPSKSISTNEINDYNAGTVETPSEPEERFRSIEQSQESTRSIISLSFAIVYLALVLAVLVYFLYTKNGPGIDKEALQDISSFLLAPVATLVGTIMGFYFGSQSKNK